VTDLPGGDSEKEMRGTLLRLRPPLVWGSWVDRLTKTEDHGFAVLAALVILCLVALSLLRVDPARAVEEPRAGESAPQTLLRSVFARYDSPRLASFSMTIRHHGNSLFASGDYSQEFKWRKGGRFTIRLTTPGEKRVPNYYGDGRRIVCDELVDLSEPPYGNLTSDRVRTILPATVHPHTLPSWEDSGGPIATILMRTPNRTSLFGTGEPKMSFSLGPRHIWQGMPVKEIVAQRRGSPRISYFIDAAGERLLGREWALSDGLGCDVYADQRVDPTLPADLGTAPPVKPGTKIVDRTAPVVRAENKSIP
jgi:hypothetical protein